MASKEIKPNASRCLECGHIEKLTKYSDGKRCTKCGERIIPCYIGTDLAHGKDMASNGTKKVL